MKLIANAVFAASLAALPVSAQMVTLSEIDVDTELEDATNAAAADFWPELAGDLTAAIGSATAIQDDAPRLVIRITEIGLDGASMRPDDGAFNTLEGWVYLYPDPAPDAEGSDFAPVLTKQIKLEASSLPVDPSVPGRIIILPGDEKFYNALVATFAERTVALIDKM